MQDQDYQSQKKTGQVSKRERICRVNGINQVALARAVIDSMNLIVTQETADAGIVSKKTNCWRNSTGQAASVEAKVDIYPFASGQSVDKEYGKGRGVAVPRC